MKITKSSFLTAWQNQKLVRGALKSAHIQSSYVNYEDLFQDGLLIYAQMLEANSNLPRKTVDYLSFRKIIWHSIDELRRSQRIADRRCDSDMMFLSKTFPQDTFLVLSQAIEGLNEVEQLIFRQHLLLGRPLKSLTKDTHLSRGYLQRLKKRLLSKLRFALST